MSDPFRVVQPDYQQLTAMEAIRNTFSYALGRIENYCPFGRDRKLAIINLEQSFSWALKAIAMEEDD